MAFDYDDAITDKFITGETITFTGDDSVIEVTYNAYVTDETGYVLPVPPSSNPVGCKNVDTSDVPDECTTLTWLADYKDIILYMYEDNVSGITSANLFEGAVTNTWGVISSDVKELIALITANKHTEFYVGGDALIDGDLDLGSELILNGTELEIAVDMSIEEVVDFYSTVTMSEGIIIGDSLTFETMGDSEITTFKNSGIDAGLLVSGNNKLYVYQNSILTVLSDEFVGSGAVNKVAYFEDPGAADQGAPVASEILFEVGTSSNLRIVNNNESSIVSTTLLSLEVVITENESIAEFIAKDTTISIGKRDTSLDTIIGKRILIDQQTAGSNDIATINGMVVDLGKLLAEVSQNIISGDTVNASAEKYAALFQGGAVMVGATTNQYISSLDFSNVDIPALFYVSANETGINIVDVEYDGATKLGVGTRNVAINADLVDGVVISVTQEGSETSLFGFKSK